MSWTVMKFGGTSLATVERVRHAAALVAAHEGQVAVVVSAQGDTTNRLEAALARHRTDDVQGNSFRVRPCSTLRRRCAIWLPVEISTLKEVNSRTICSRNKIMQQFMNI